MKGLDDTRLLLPRSFSHPTAVHSVQHCREQRRNEEGALRGKVVSRWCSGGARDGRCIPMSELLDSR